MESGPFSRRSWATQSLRVTAKELSLVSGRGKTTAIAERFSKYQKAAEVSSADKKKGESKTASLRSGNLSALKKRWEQAQNREDKTSPSGPPASDSGSHRRPPALTRLPSIREKPPPVKSPGLLTTQGGPESTASRVQTSTAAPQASKSEELNGMDRDEVTNGKIPEKLEEQVPTSPRAYYEKPSVPLNNLKMRFERGEDATGKGGRTMLRSTSSDDMDQQKGPSVSDRVLESSSLREKMAKYQAAVSKQGDEASKAPAPHKHTPTPECNGESNESSKASRKFCPPARETCVACSKTVYPLERLMAQQHVYHKSCFKCTFCNTRLSLGTFASLHGNVYCKPHFSQLFKTKGNYDEGFGHRPHKEQWEPRVNGEEEEEEGAGEEVAKPKERAQPQLQVMRSTEDTSDTEPTPDVEPSSQLKVTDVAALLETRAQTRATSTEKQSTEKPAETRRLRIAWPPPAGEGHAVKGPLSPLTEEVASIRPGRAKWPPDDEEASSFQSSERVELKSLRRSHSLKERSRPFTLVAKSNPAPSLGPRERRRPLKSLLDWRASFEEKNPSDKEKKPEEQQEKKKEHVMPSKDAAHERKSVSEDEATVSKQQEDGDEQEHKESVAAAAAAAEDASLRSSSSPDLSPSSSPPLQPKQNRASQDVGFWEEEKEGSDNEEPSAEDIIKRNRYYDEEDSDS
nr:LIM domain and actin-binding protein 1-like [Solea senegalensis]